MKKRALVSVSDKTGLVEFVKGLVDLGWEIIATGGTQKLLEQSGIHTTGISEVTGFPEILDGRVKTLHPKVHGGILARRELPEHMETLRENGIETIDLVCVNLYPFRETIAKEGVTLEDAIEHIDIGGPSMVRSAAKNWRDVTIVCNLSHRSRRTSRERVDISRNPSAAIRKGIYPYCRIRHVHRYIYACPGRPSRKALP